jgi:hypothetical protein
MAHKSNDKQGDISSSLRTRALRALPIGRAPGKARLTWLDVCSFGMVMTKAQGSSPELILQISGAGAVLDTVVTATLGRTVCTHTDRTLAYIGYYPRRSSSCSCVGSAGWWTRAGARGLAAAMSTAGICAPD